MSSPTFAPGEIEERFPELRDDPGAPLLNRATQSAYVPGSVFKLVTAAAVVDKGLVDLDEPFSCTTALNLGGQPVDCRNSIHVPRLTLKQAFAWSSNRTFALAGLALAEPGPINRWLDDRPGARYPWADGDVSAAARELEEYARRFGFESELPFDLPVRPSRLKQPDSPWSVALLAATAFGQGELAVTPLQMAIVAATVANDGLVPRPYLVSALRDPAGREAPVHQPGGWLGRATSPETARILRDFMVEGVERGYASPARLQGVQVGGKTGTAETGPGQPPHAWFIGFAPADTPRVAIAVVVEHGGSGSEVAAPIAREVLRVALDVYRPG